MEVHSEEVTLYYTCSAEDFQIVANSELGISDEDEIRPVYGPFFPKKPVRKEDLPTEPKLLWNNDVTKGLPKGYGVFERPQHKTVKKIGIDAFRPLGSCSKKGALVNDGKENESPDMRAGLHEKVPIKQAMRAIRKLCSRGARENDTGKGRD